MAEEKAVEAYNAQPDIFQERDPKAVLSRFAGVAKEVGSIIDKEKLYVAISGRKHVRIEGWQALGVPFGIFAIVITSQRIKDGERWGYEAKANAQRVSGELVSSADAECWSDEPNWQGKPDFQIRSMAQTRACAKALRLALGFVMAMAGYEATSAEEMVPENRARDRPAPKRQPTKKNGPNYSHFWTSVRSDLGLESETVHGLLKVASLKDWVSAGYTLGKALEMCEEYVGLIQQGWDVKEAEAEIHRKHFEPDDQDPELPMD